MGKGHSQELKCSAAQSAAAVFEVLASSFVQTQLINRNTSKPCGGYFYGGYRRMGRVRCMGITGQGVPAPAAGARVLFRWCPTVLVPTGCCGACNTVPARRCAGVMATSRHRRRVTRQRDLG